MRRSLLLATALAALVVWHPGPAQAAGATMPCWLRGDSVPEPQPIEVAPATVDRATSILNAMAQGTFDRAQLIPELQRFGNTAVFFERAKTIVDALGPVQTMFPFEQRITAGETSTYFRVHYAKETLTWVISVGPQNDIAGLSLRRTATCLLVNIVDQGYVPY